MSVVGKALSASEILESVNGVDGLFSADGWFHQPNWRR